MVRTKITDKNQAGSRDRDSVRNTQKGKKEQPESNTPSPNDLPAGKGVLDVNMINIEQSEAPSEN